MQQVTKRREGRGQERELSCFFISATFLFPLTEKSVENRDGAKVVKRERERELITGLQVWENFWLGSDLSGKRLPKGCEACI